ncbi:MAG: hypothetical protein K1X47_01905 [Cyclobacteriaceae bacterium]|nr:hypothetical protein [Cyclobacteriaceae bacterium]
MKKYALVGSLLLALWSCHSDEAPPNRTYRMGFQNSAPAYDDINVVLQSLSMWTSRADAAMITTEVPWDSLIAGIHAGDYVKRNYLELVNYYRSKNLPLWVYIDPENGLNRATDAVPLKNSGRSIAEPAMQLLYRQFVIAMDSVLHPEHIGLALETNLIRTAAPPSIYAGVRQAANDAAKDLAQRGSAAIRSVSVQIDLLWGLHLNPPVFQDLQKELDDFPFASELGMSSYPYFYFESPASMPADYYSRLKTLTSLPLFVSEGGWSSVNPGSSASCTCSETQQTEYFLKQATMLDAAAATAWFQLPFTDIDGTHIAPQTEPSIQLFLHLGLVDIHLQPKPVLATWDQIFARKRSIP